MKCFSLPPTGEANGGGADTCETEPMAGIGGARIDCFTDASPERSGRRTDRTDMHQQGEQLQEHYLPFPLPVPLAPVLRGVAFFAEYEDSAGAASAACVLDSEAVWPSEERLPEKRVSLRRPPRPRPRPVRLPRPRPVAEWRCMPRAPESEGAGELLSRMADSLVVPDRPENLRECPA